jgi:hypothetical protein
MRSYSYPPAARALRARHTPRYAPRVRAVWSSKRVWLPFAAAVLCLTAANWTGPVLSWVLVMASFGFCLDGVTLMWSRSGGLSDFRQ